MSIGKYIHCKDCNEKLWVGQNDYVYTGDEEVMDCLGEFLVKHEAHTLYYGISKNDL